jgi:hypothetical protein
MVWIVGAVAIFLADILLGAWLIDRAWTREQVTRRDEIGGPNIGPMAMGMRAGALRFTMLTVDRANRRMP